MLLTFLARSAGLDNGQAERYNIYTPSRESVEADMGVRADEREGRRVPQGARAASGCVCALALHHRGAWGRKGALPVYPLSGTARYSR